MEEKDFKKGISILYDMELNNYLMTRSIQRLDYQIAKLGKKRTIEKPEQKYDNRLAIETVDPSVKRGFFIGGIIGVISGFIWGMSWTNSPLAFFCGCIGAAILGIVFCMIGAVIGLIIGWIKGNIEIADNNIELEEEYNLVNGIYEVRVQLDNERVERELDEKSVLLAQKEALLLRRKESRTKLEIFYEKMGIDTNYRGLMPIAYMYEFIRLNISKKLEGADGLYYLVSRELKADKMYLKLEEISIKLDTVVDNQHKLYSKLTELNERCEELIENTCIAAQIAAENNSLLQEAVENTSIAAYNSERIAIENEYQSFLLTLSCF